MNEFLKIYQMEGKSLSWWNTRRRMINIEPSYQRKGRRWSVSDKAYLIDSMINGYDLPKFYLVDFTFGGGGINSEGFQYAVIDGKQRFEAIFDFIDNKFPLSKDFLSREYPEEDFGGLTYSELEGRAPYLKESFDNYNLTVMGVIAGQEKLINEIFIRLNRGRPLNGAELRNAVSGPLGSMVRDISRHKFFMENIRFAVTKSQDLNLINKLIKFEVEEGPGDTKKSSLDKFVKEVSHDRVERAYFNLKHNLDDLSDVFLPKDSLLKSEGPIPVYYWCFRDLDGEERPFFRDFLSSFEAHVKGTEDLMKKDKDIGYFDLEEYRRYARSINDRQSNIMRYKILRSNFDRWKKEMCGL